jgi:hypothetical protein
MMGEMSMAQNCILSAFLIGASIGSVVRCRNWTIGLNGSGFTQLMRALNNISSHNNVNITSSTFAIAAIKFPKTNISYLH